MFTTHHKDDFALNGGAFHWFHGVVEDINDPMKLGRIRVRCIGYHTDDRGKLPTSALPWALCLLPATSASMVGTGQSATGILQGSWVIGFFRDGPSAQDPIILGSIASKVVKKPDFKKGFSDPAAKNPEKTGDDIPIETLTGTAGPKGDWSQTVLLDYIHPEYPNNQVIRTRCGHVIEYDDTAGYERVSLMHTTGAFIEIDNAGNINICGNKVNIMATENIAMTSKKVVNIKGSPINLN